MGLRPWAGFLRECPAREACPDFRAAPETHPRCRSVAITITVTVRVTGRRLRGALGARFEWQRRTKVSTLERGVSKVRPLSQQVEAIARVERAEPWRVRTPKLDSAVDLLQLLDREFTRAVHVPPRIENAH